MWGWQVLVRREEIESLPLANNGLSRHIASTSAYHPTADIRWPMSVIVLISSAYPSSGRGWHPRRMSQVDPKAT